jgi:hypothetical protein
VDQQLLCQSHYTSRLLLRHAGAKNKVALFDAAPLAGSAMALATFV